MLKQHHSRYGGKDEKWDKCIQTRKLAIDLLLAISQQLNLQTPLKTSYRTNINKVPATHFCWSMNFWNWLLADPGTIPSCNKRRNSHANIRNITKWLNFDVIWNTLKVKPHLNIQSAIVQKKSWNSPTQNKRKRKNPNMMPARFYQYSKTHNLM